MKSLGKLWRNIWPNGLLSGGQTQKLKPTTRPAESGRMSSSVKTLREIFLNPDYSLRRRIKAASAILAFETPTEIIEETKGFLTEIFENPELHIDLRFEALEVMRKA